MSTPSGQGGSVSDYQHSRASYECELTSVILELEVPDFVDEKRLEGRVEERERFEPSEPSRKLVAVDEEAGEEEAVTRRRSQTWHRERRT